jgi:ferredoxin
MNRIQRSQFEGRDVHGPVSTAFVKCPAMRSTQYALLKLIRGSDSMPKVTIANEKREIEVPAGANLRTALRAADVQVYSGIHKLLNCRGLGLCGTCKVIVKKGMENLTPKTFMEKFRLGVSLASIGHENDMRLSCQLNVKDDCTIETQPTFNTSGENFWQKPYPNK